MDLDDTLPKVNGPKNAVWKLMDLDDTPPKVNRPKNAVWKLMDLDDTSPKVNGPTVHLTLSFLSFSIPFPGQICNCKVLSWAHTFLLKIYLTKFLKKNIMSDCFKMFKTLYKYNKAKEKEKAYGSGYLDGKIANWLITNMKLSQHAIHNCHV